LGYDPPDGDEIVAIPFGGRARAGAAALDEFIDGLRAASGHAHRGEPAHVTVIGHSYGTAVIGEAASRGDGLAVDEIVAVGSPGLRVDHASDLSVGADHVWVLAATNDHVANPRHHAGWPLGGLASWIEQAAHGPAPHEPTFGAQRLDAEPSGHSGYWAPGSKSLANQARVVLGEAASERG
jgi:pimeloyl-ACP methyl ester carboxylesterase